MDTSEVHKIIKNYVQTAGGEVSIEDLTSDFKIAYRTHIPFDGFPDLFSFLRTIHGLQLKERDGNYYLISLKKSPLKPINTTNDSQDIANICVQVSNNLVIGDNNVKRKVIVNKSSYEQSNNYNRRLIRNKMNQYLRTSMENSTNESKEPSNYSYSSNHADYAQPTSNPVYPEYLARSTNPTLLEYSPNVNSTLPQMPIIVNDSSLSLKDVNSLFPEYSSKGTYAEESASSSVSPDGSTFEYVDNFYSHEANPTTKSSVWPNYTENMYYMLLIDLVTKHNLELPRFETSTYLSDTQIVFTTVLKVGNENFISPSYTSSSANIYEDLLKNAYESLKKKIELHDTPADHDIVSQIVELVNSFKMGVDADTIEIAYVKEYRTSLPLNWISLVESSLSIYTENVSNCIFMYPIRSFLTATPYSNSLPGRVYPNSDTWNIMVTDVFNTGKIYFRFLDEEYNDRYQSLVSKMRQHYDGKFMSDMKEVKTSELYAYFTDGEWYRVEVLSSQINNVECLLIDMGIERTIPIGKLLPLDHKFTNTPPLANCCSMAGLTKYREVNYISCKLKQMICNEIASAKVDEMNNEELSLVIYLKNERVNINVNQYFSSKIRKELFAPKLEEVGKLYDVNLLRVDDRGLARIQIESDSLYLLIQSLEKAAQKIDRIGNLYATSLLKLDMEKIYLTKIDDNWERVMIKKFLNSVKVNVQCIDTGELRTADVKSIVPIDQLPDTLKHISPQFKEVQISQLDDVIGKIIKFLNRFNLRDMKLTIKIVKISEHVEVEFHKKLPNEQTIPLKNVFLYSNDQINNMDVMDNFSNILPAELCFDLFHSNGGNLPNDIPRYEISIGSTLRVRVTKVINPSNFVLKIENQERFNQLMLDLNNFNIIFSPKPVDNISMGSCYAVKLDNGLWYRGLAHYVFEEAGVIIIHLLDFGEIVSVPSTSIYPMPAVFYSLPVQTFSAELFNVKATLGEWTSNDCYRFRELVSQKVLNCVVVDNTAPIMKVILLQDCNNEVENVSSILLNERRAVCQ